MRVRVSGEERQEKRREKRRERRGIRERGTEG